MYALMFLVSCLICAYADDSQDRRSKLPYIADAIGNTLPRPSNVPATVGSPVNLISPDRYEFYTFDESGELVKRLMTLEEIQAIVAAGEDAEGLVTFANDEQPTVEFNFSQPSYTKVNNVVTNVQNVLKAQMEAHKNNPQIQPTFDTPDVSDSWSLILPSIFGNTGVDIVPDKSSGSFITPETETIEVDNLNNDFSSGLHKEVSNTPLTTSITESTKNNINPKVEVSEIELNASSNISPENITLEQVSNKPTFSNIYNNIITDTTSIKKSTARPHATTSTTVKVNPITTHKLTTKTDNTISSTSKISMKENTQANMGNKNDNNFATEPVTRKSEQQEINEFIPISMIAHTTEKTGSQIKSKFNSTNSSDLTLSVVTKTPNNVISSTRQEEYEKNNSTTLTTQSVSPSTTISSTEILPPQSNNDNSNNHHNNIINVEQPIVPLFDVAQSISQIASDLGNNFVPIPTVNSIQEDTTKSNVDMESKENIEIDIPTESDKSDDEKKENGINTNNIIKESSFIELKSTNLENVDKESFVDNTVTTVSNTVSTTISESMETTTLDYILSGSMSDLLSQVVYQGTDDERLPEENKSSEENLNKDKNETEYEGKINNSDNVEKLLPTTETDIETTTYYKENEHNEDDSILNDKEETTTIVNHISSENIPNYVKVSIPIGEPITEVMYVPSNKKNITKINVSTVSEVIMKHPQENNVTRVTQNTSIILPSEKSEESIPVTSLPKIKLTTSYAMNVNKSNVSPSIQNKLNLPESIKVKNKINNQKLNGELPKVDEFKKKIQKINIDDKELANERNNSWKLIPSVSPPKLNDVSNQKPEGFYTPENSADKNINLEFSTENQGLEVTTKGLGEDISQFIELCNELAFQYWNDLTENLDKKRSFVLSPYSITSMLAMMFMGARGATSGEMNEVLKLDDMVTFNPHFTLKNISDSIDISPTSGIAASAFIRELYSDRSKGKLLTFYKERAQQFYNGHVEEVNFKLISDIIRRRTNLLVKRYTWGKITEFLKSNNIVMHPPLAAFSANIFQTDCTGTSVEGRDGEMYFVVSPTVRQRRLVPVPAVVYRSNFLAGYDPMLDATAAALGNTNSIISTLFLMPGQQGNIVHADDLEVLEKRLLSSGPTTSVWNRLLRTLLPRVGLELQIPRFSHKSIFNISSSLQKMGLKDLFSSNHADLGGLNGPSKNLYLTDMVQLTSFVTCGEGVIGEQHHIEEYPETLGLTDSTQKRRSSRWLGAWDEPRDYQRAFHDPHDVGEAMHLPLHLRPRQARLPARSSQPARLKYDRPFLYFVRHNPSGMILYVGRYNPRLLP